MTQRILDDEETLAQLVAKLEQIEPIKWEKQEGKWENERWNYIDSRDDSTSVLFISYSTQLDRFKVSIDDRFRTYILTILDGEKELERLQEYNDKKTIKELYIKIEKNVNSYQEQKKQEEEKQAREVTQKNKDEFKKIL